MIPVYSTDPLPTAFKQSLFLAGPTSRTSDVVSWRLEALRILEEQGYEGVVFVPEPRDEKWPSFEDQVRWEDEALNRSDIILFWIPRNMKTLPGLTTNIEFGRWERSGKVVLGFPPESDHNRYLSFYADRLFIPQNHTLSETIATAVAKIGEGTLRSGGECNIPFHIWQAPSFQQWYQTQKKVGNRLDGAKQEWAFFAGDERHTLFFWVLHVDIYIASEDRHKTNEVVIARPDISVVVLYHQTESFLDTDVVFIREFRSPASTSDGCIHEIPGGSSFIPQDFLSLALEEVKEEIGLSLDPSRVCCHESRQTSGTLSAHKAHLFSVKLSDDEFFCLQEQAREQKVHGVINDSERTYIELWKISDLLSPHQNEIDWATLGMILSTILRT
ncbi:MAG: hypothetical protein A2042_01645 [Candidatus Schekmanbacteria bacterium GWA2_38_11]|uniref:Nudix hydrolase domain-containing protein n=3 Tax=Bacteria candidate phyla TaxID=1783234 RepID=A0A1F7RP15_9BACT|nr:MAG: hypothetical protein UU35_C0003G0050 [Candidatus Uhrbacteria bacterium GW2011_GWC2_41_11]KKR98378.1 MAG: hypothetical protein UU48_C0003G0050 [Candidatus Uhrbacteria bacterium GW2011_GWF2_41_16]OGL43292.1 MAG: hypothetical protein A2042_01645 [Candidatus Schekmanbacteria bacterium GWA2_38_11]HBO99895.1 NUDIX hydrolase [Candidatus Uhrbacteria bacterium]